MERSLQMSQETLRNTQNPKAFRTQQKLLDFQMKCTFYREVMFNFHVLFFGAVALVQEMLVDSC